MMMAIVFNAWTELHVVVPRRAEGKESTPFCAQDNDRHGDYHAFGVRRDSNLQSYPHAIQGIHAQEQSIHLADGDPRIHPRQTETPQALRDLVTDGYLRQVPIDPMTGNSNSWRVI